LYENQLTGNIPTELGNLTNLTGLFLYENQLDGIIPKELGNLSKLDCMSLFNNQFSGNLPSELAKLSNLTKINVSNNQLVGKIPPELGQLENLTALDLSENQITGSIPSELGNLSNLTLLSLFDNLLLGCIPRSIGGLSNLLVLNLQINNLSGEIPAEFMNLTNLLNERSDFRNNHLYTSNSELKNFLDQKQIGGDWLTSQTFDTTIPMIEPSSVCGVYSSGNCFSSFEDAFIFSTSPSVIFVGEGEYHENVVIEDSFTLEFTWANDFSCNPPTGPVIISGPLAD
jgi:hypothetical protein